MTENPYPIPDRYTSSDAGIGLYQGWKEGYQAGVKKALEEVEELLYTDDYCDEYINGADFESLKSKLLEGKE